MHFESIKEAINDAFFIIEDIYEKRKNIPEDYKFFSGTEFKSMRFSQIVCLSAAKDVCLVTAAYNLFNQIAKSDRPVAIFTAMPKEYLAIRMVAEHSGVSLRRIITGNLRPEDWGALTCTVGCIYDLPLIINNDFRSVEDIVKQVSRYDRFREKGPGAVIIDSFQYISGKSEKEIKKSIGKLRVLSKITVPVILTLNVECNPKDPYKGLLTELCQPC